MLTSLGCKSLIVQLTTILLSPYEEPALDLGWFFFEVSLPSKGGFAHFFGSSGSQNPGDRLIGKVSAPFQQFFRVLNCQNVLDRI